MSPRERGVASLRLARAFLREAARLFVAPPRWCKHLGENTREQYLRLAALLVERLSNEPSDDARPPFQVVRK
jgi:hypothetical protein